jgi:hypothetical protein
MSSDQINTSNYSKDDYSGFYPHKHSIASRENSRFGPSMNPDLFIPNLELGGAGSPPAYLIKYQPEEPEPTEQQLVCAKQAASECASIKEKLSVKWLGIDYSDPNAAYNCFCNDAPGAPPGPATDFWVANTPSVGPQPEKNSQFTVLPSVAANSSGNYTPPNYESANCGTNFEKYIELSKTNATFWNTPPKTPLYRRAQTALLSYNRIKILVHGDFKIKPGKLIKIDYSLYFQNNSQIKASRHDGIWMVYKVQHIITGIKHSMYLYLMRDGSAIAPGSYGTPVIET